MLEMVFKRKEKNIEKQQKGKANLAVSIGFLFCAYHLSVSSTSSDYVRNKITAVQKSQSYCHPVPNSAMKRFCAI